jgi:hypothetical protein
VDLGLVCAYQGDAQSALKRYVLEPMFEDEIRAAVVADIVRSTLVCGPSWRSMTSRCLRLPTRY